MLTMVWGALELSGQATILVSINIHMEQQSDIKSVTKVGLIGDRKVGKTFLHHQLTHRQPPTQSDSTEVVRSWPVKHSFTYVDTSQMDTEAITQIGSVHQYDILLFLFKDCDTFTSLYEFLVEVKDVIQESPNHHVREYWTHLKKVFLVYSDYESKMTIQLEQLFPILEQQIRNFCETVSIQTFTITTANSNIPDLKTLLEVEPVRIERHAVTPISQDVQPPQLEKEQSQKEDTNQAPKKQEEPVQQNVVSEHVNVKDIIQALDEEQPQSQPTDINVNKPEEVRLEEVRKSHFDDRKSRIYKKIQDSFFGSSVKEEEEAVPPEAPLEYIQVKKQANEEQLQVKTEAKDPKLFQQFRKSSHYDPEKAKQIDEKLQEYNAQKEDELKQCDQVSLTEERNESKEEKAEDINRTDMYTKEEEQREERESEERQQLIAAEKKEIIRQQLVQLQPNGPGKHAQNGKPRTNIPQSPSRSLGKEKQADQQARGCECLLM